MKKIRLISWLAAAFFCAAAFAEACGGASVRPQPYYGEIARALGLRLPVCHLSQKPLNDDISIKAWTNLVTAYDFNHDVFLKSDLALFEPMKKRIDNAIRRGDVSFGYDIYKIYLQRMTERLDFATNLLAAVASDPDADKKLRAPYSGKDFLWQRKDAPWPGSREEQDELWRSKIRNEILAQVISRELDREDELSGKRKASSTTNREVSVFTANDAATNLIKRYTQYMAVLTEPDEEMILQKYLSSVSTAYDPHSDYMSPAVKEDFDMEMNLSLCGVGAVLQLDDGALKIMEIMSGGPIDCDGRIKKGDKIVGVGQGDGPVEDCMYRPMRKTIKKIRGPKGTKVVLEIEPKNNPHQRKLIDLVRDEIKLEDQAATGRVEKVVLNGVTNTVGYLVLPAFYGTMDKSPDSPDFRSACDDMAKEIARMNAQGVSGLVFDLRLNGGGSLGEALKIAGLFIPRGPVVQVLEGGRLHVLPAPYGHTVAFRKPLVVLIDKASASASEIVAGVLQDTGRAVIAGDSSSHGKGTVQTVMDLGSAKYGSAKITTARFYRVTGSSTQVKGVESDIHLPSIYDELDMGEAKLPNALPWTAVAPADYSICWNMKSLIPELKRLSLERTSVSSNFVKHVKKVHALKEVSERKTVTLDYAKRKKIMRSDRDVDVDGGEDIPDKGGSSEVSKPGEDESDDKVGGGDASGGGKSKKGLRRSARSRKKEMRKTKDDPVLEESFNILCDMIRLTGGAQMDAGLKPRGVNWSRIFGD